MSAPASEAEIRERIAEQVRANPEIGFVHSRGRGAFNIETIAPLVRESGGSLHGCVIRPLGFIQIEDPERLGQIKKILRYGLVFILTFDDNFSETITSTDYFSDEMIARTDFLLSMYRLLGYDPSTVRHDLLQFPQDWSISPSERFGKYHLALGTLNVNWWLPADECS